MVLTLSPSISSGSFDGAEFARYLLESDSGLCTPPRITRLGFEDDYARENLTSSLSGQFSSYYGLPYDRSPPPEENNQDAVSEYSSRGPSTPPAPDHLSLPVEPSSPLTMTVKPLDDPFTQDSTSLFLDPHSLPPGHALLSDTPSYLGLVSARSEELSSRPSPSRPQTMPTPMPVPTRQPIQPIEDSSSLPGTNRAFNMRQLALELPVSRSRSGSLSTLIHALEDASPGWYQSLMDSALPHSGSQSSLSAANVLPRTKSPRRPPHNSAVDSATRLEGLPKDMLVNLAELEALAVVIGRLPIPRPRTMALELAATAFFTTSSAQPPLPTKKVCLRAIPLTPLEEERERQPTVRYAPTVATQEEDRFVDNASSSSSPRSEHHDYDYPCDQSSTDHDHVGSTNAKHHPKNLAMGTRSSLPATSRFLAPAPKTPSWRAGRHSAIPRMSAQDSLRARPPLPQADTKTPKKAPQPPHKTPKPLNLQSLFRRRPSAPPMPMQPPDLGTTSSPVRNTAKRAAHLSEPVMRPPLHRTTGDSPLGKSSGAPPEIPYTFQPQSPLGSFLPM